MPSPVLANAKAPYGLGTEAKSVPRAADAATAGGSRWVIAAFGRGLAATPAVRWPRQALTATVACYMLLVPGGLVLAAAPVQQLRCTNSESGSSWTVVVNFDRGRVDSLPASITDDWISWYDPKQGHFELERRTGKLELRNASSTGGYFLHYMCRAE